MKKFYTFASTLMLALSMALMTACSNDNDLVIDKTVVAEGSRTVTLKVTADMGAETRVATQGLDGKDDAFRITGWKDGDEVKVLALESDGSEHYEEITFTYDANTGEFTGSVPNGFELNELKYAYVGGKIKEALLDDECDWVSIDISTPIAISDPEDCFLFGDVIVDGKSISANLTAPYALACVHNNTRENIEVGQITAFDDFLEEYLSYTFDGASFKFVGDIIDGEHPLKYTVPAGQKAYFVIPPRYSYGYTYYGLYDFTNGNIIAAPKDITIGKVYKVQVYPFGTGTAKATIGATQVDVKWVQLWVDGPKFAEYNVGVTDGKVES